MTPQIILIAITLLSLGIVIAKHGEPRENYNFWTELISNAIIFGLLYWGGFFNCFMR